MLENYFGSRIAEGDCGTDINIFFYADNQAAHHSRVADAVRNTQAKNYLPQTRFDQRDDYHQQQQIRDAHLGVHKPLQYQVEFTAI